ncbi:MAG: transglutaminase domain-containing protein [Candidatus Dormibacteraeota bacterium]|nr:transglutaminase domain-containing protein [Candidatus Dormibacteraeota bacterium]
MPLFSPALLVALAAVAIVGAWALHLIETGYDDGCLKIRFVRRVSVAFGIRDTWLLLALAIVMGWAVAAALESAAWVSSSEGHLVPAIAIGTIIGWALAISPLSRLGFITAGVTALLVPFAVIAPTPLTSAGVAPAALSKWVMDLPGQPSIALLLGLIALMLLCGLWSGWWIFRRRLGLVALLPTGSLLAVEIINDTNALLWVFSIAWVSAATSILLRLNFVTLKERWRVRRLPRASDTGWTFGEVGVEAIGALLLAAFLLIPPLSSADISGFLVPGTLSTDSLHPFGLGSGGGGGHVAIGSIGYSETVRPGSQLKAKSQTVMIVSGDNATYYPYWRGIALGGWDGIAWYQLPSTPDMPIRDVARIAARQVIPRDDLPQDPNRLQTSRDTFRVLVPVNQTANAVFSAGEVISVENQPTTVRGIATSTGAGTIFDTVDRIRFSTALQPPYTYVVTEATPKVDATTLRNAGTDYPAWLAPYQSLYYGGRTAQGYAVTRDAEIANLAQTIVRAAGATNAYDQAKAIESWFLSKGRFTYTLTPPPAPAGVRPLDYFLFTSRKGFCQDFSTAMNVMLRTLGIPSRQISGFGQGTFDEKTRRYLVNSLDAHSWVEAFFPGYGWIPFEATPDGINLPVTRPNTAAELNAPPVTAAVPTSRPRSNPADATPTGSSAGSNGLTSFWEPLAVAAALLVLLVLLLLAAALRWLMAVRDMPRIWRRLQFLADRLHVARHDGDTAEEFASRLARSVPPLERDLHSLGALYTRASFRRGGLDAAEAQRAREAWLRVRQRYAGLVARAWRDALLNGQVVRAGEDEASRNRGRRRRRQETPRGRDA